MTRIPKILHYTFGLARDFGGRPWSLVHYVCLKSAVERIAPEKTFFYYEFEPNGPWWGLTREFITPVRIEAPREIFGRPLAHVAHRADVVRLQKLIEHGGIYLDADVLVHRGFDDLLSHSAVLGEEGINSQYGLTNAVILAEPESPFLRRWLDAYRSFRSTGRWDKFWNEHGVKVPSELARTYPREITVLPHTAFFWPLWTEEHLDWIYASDRPIPMDQTYANHLWETNAWKYLEDLTPRQVRSVDTNFHIWARPLIDDLPDNFGAPTLARRFQKQKRRSLQKARDLKSYAERCFAAARRRAKRLITSEQARRRQIFQKVYKHNLWGSDGNSKYFSGVGSRGEAADIYVERMAELLKRHVAELGRPITIIDLGCGDFQVGRALVTKLPDLNYVGCDIVPELIAHNAKVYATAHVSFRRLDIVADPLPGGDVYLVRQVLQHLSNTEIMSFLQRVSCKYLYVTEGHPVDRIGSVNPDKVTGPDVRFDWRTGRGRGVELDKPPYGLSTQEMFRVFSPNEVIITELVLPELGDRRRNSTLTKPQRTMSFVE